MVIFGVQIANIDWGEGLSPAVEAAIPALVDAVIEEIEKGEDHAQDSGN
jgi:Ni,Fe-hydrogenase maturation factor